MSNDVELAQGDLERAAHLQHPGHHQGGPDSHVQQTALLIAALAAALALAEIGEKGAQNEYLTRHIAVSDDWSFYQAKTIRATVATETAEILASLPPGDLGLAKRIDAANRLAARMESDPATGEGKEQLRAKALHDTALRDQALERYHSFDKVTGALQIAIVLASASVVTRSKLLIALSGALGAVAGVFGVLVALGVVG